MLKVKINGLDNSRTYLNKTGEKLGRNFQNEIIKRSRELSIKMQKDLNDSVDKGAVPFTNRAVLFLYRKKGTGVSTTIMIKDIQAHYLYEVLVQPKPIDKFIPTSKARLTSQGNIAGLKRNLSNGRFKVVKGKNGKERLIDTKQKKKEKRVIAVRESKRRKLIYDFYRNAEKGAVLIMSDIRGSFIVKKG